MRGEAESSDYRHESEKRNSRGCGSFPVCGISVVNQKQQKFRTLQMHEKVAKSKKAPDFARNQELFGGDYWTRASVLLRVKIRMDVKGLRLGVFRQFLPHFLQAQYLPSPLRPPAYFLILVKGPAPPNLAEPGLFHEAK